MDFHLSPIGLLLCVILFCLSVSQEVTDLLLNLSLEEFVEKHGYTLELHHVETEDGYILGLHHITRNVSTDASKSSVGPPVLLMHGLLGCSADWILTGENRSLAFLLTDHGYDVWLGNTRGTTVSKNHKTLLTNNTEFWNFSWHEIGLYDTSAMINYILDYTKEKQLYYIGFSQGTTQFWVLMSLRPEYNEKIKLMCALAPVAYTGNIRGLLRPLSRLAQYGEELNGYSGYFEVLPNSELVKQTGNYMCQRGTRSYIFCQLILFAIAGHSAGEFDTEYLGRYLSFSPAGCSSKQLMHYAAGLQHPGHFRQYDYGKEKNLVLYGTAEPPEYPLEKVVAPVALYIGANDWLAHPKDVELLSRTLPNVVDKYVIKLKKLNHFDLLYGMHISDLLYKRIIQKMDSYR